MPLICGVPPIAENCETSPGRVRTPPGKKSTSPRLGDIPTGTSDGSSSVTHVENVFSGNGENVSMDMMILSGSYGERNLSRSCCHPERSEGSLYLRIACSAWLLRCSEPNCV